MSGLGDERSDKNFASAFARTRARVSGRQMSDLSYWLLMATRVG